VGKLKTCQLQMADVSSGLSRTGLLIIEKNRQSFENTDDFCDVNFSDGISIS
jgi:hypothetical protein